MDIEIEDGGGEEIESLSFSEYVAAAFYALSATAEIDTLLMSREDADRIESIKKKSIDIIEFNISVLHSSLFP